MKKIILILSGIFALACSCEPRTPDTPAAPAVPEGVKLHSATESSLSFQWTPVEGANSYDWRLTEGSTEVQKGTVQARSVVISGLTKGTAYRFAVRSAGEGGTSDWSSWFDATTEGGSETPVTPVDPPVVDPAHYEDFGIPEYEEDGKPRAFPGAEGGGMWATGGRGGKIYHVTSLEDSGSKEGTLRYGIEKGERPLTIVFDVDGIIALNSMLNVKKGDLTIAGQTAPGDGICLKNYTFRVSASNVIVRFIRCRMGDEKKTEDDAIQVMDHDDDKFSDIIIDHCSVSWCTDECASFYGMKNFTFSWNIVSESLRVSVHGKGNHGYGGIWGGTNATYHHNFLAHHDSRNPRIDHDYVSTQKGPVTIANNVVYNWSGNTCYGGESSSKNGSGYRKYNFVGNYYKPGPATPSNHMWLLDPTTKCSNCGGTILPGHFYMTGNILHGKDDVNADNWKGTTASENVISQIKATEPFAFTESPSSLSLQSAGDAFDAVLTYAGASYARDIIDERLATEARNGSYTYTGSKGNTKGLIDTQEDVGGWPEYKAGEDIHDSDADGMPDWFEEQFGLAKTNPADAAAGGLDKNGRYTNLEMYLHYLVKDIVNGGNSKGTYTQL
jgi:pectate lyase